MGSTDSNGKYYCRVNVEGQSVFCHSSHFIEAVDENSCIKAARFIWMYLRMKKGLTGQRYPFGARPLTASGEGTGYPQSEAVQNH